MELISQEEFELLNNQPGEKNLVVVQVNGTDKLFYISLTNEDKLKPERDILDFIRKTPPAGVIIESANIRKYYV